MKKYLVLPLVFPLTWYYLFRNFMKVIPDTWEDLTTKIHQLSKELEE